MLPACRTAGDEFAIPTFELTPRDVADFTDELQEFQGLFHDCFPRSEPRAHFFDYMVGQLSPLERKSIEPMALRVSGGSVRGLQRFLSEVPWDEEHMRWTYHQLVADEMGAPDGVLMFDETGFVKKGTDSAGVARQYCGTLGKVENCQVGVFAGYASRKGYALVDKRLFLAGGLVDGRVCRPSDQVSGPSRGDLAEQTTVSGRHVAGHHARGAAPVQIPRGRLPLWQ
jgi:DDE superfamily endonuclease